MHKNLEVISFVKARIMFSDTFSFGVNRFLLTCVAETMKLHVLVSAKKEKPVSGKRTGELGKEKRYLNWESC